MQPHQQRVVDAQLPKDEQARLRRQFDIMIQYEGVLQERIDHFPN